MNKREIEIILKQRLPEGRQITLKENPIFYGHNASWGSYEYSSTGIDYHIYPHVLVESFPAIIEFDHSEKGSGVQGLIEQGTLTITKFKEVGWHISYNNRYSSIVLFSVSNFSSAVYLMNDWLEKNKENYKVIE